MVEVFSIFVCTITSLIGVPFLCKENDVTTPGIEMETCAAGTRSARVVLSASDLNSNFQTILYCTDNSKVDFDSFVNTPNDLSIATPMTLLTAAAGGCALDGDDLKVTCGYDSVAFSIDVTVCCRESDSGLNALVTSKRQAGSTVAPGLSVTSSDDTDEIFFLKIMDYSLTTTAPSGCSVGNINYACSFSDDTEVNQAYVRF